MDKVFEHIQEGKMTIQQTEESTNRVSNTPNMTAYWPFFTRNGFGWWI